MPTLRVELFPGRTPEQKQQYMEQVTRLTSDVLKCPLESIDVIFIEIEPSDWAHAGKFYAQPSS